MMRKQLSVFKYLFVILLIFSKGSQGFAKSKIQDLTSSENQQAVGPLSGVNNLNSNLKVHSLGLGLGQTFLQGNFDNRGEDKITWDVYYTYSASFSFDMIANYHLSTHSYRGEKVKVQGIDFGIKSKFFQFDEFSPFAMGGLGFYYPKEQRITSNGESITSEGKFVFGMHMGAGVELRLNKKFIMGMLFHYHDPFDVPQEYGPSISGSYTKLLLTVLYSFQ